MSRYNNPLALCRLGTSAAKHYAYLMLFTLKPYNRTD